MAPILNYVNSKCCLPAKDQFELKKNDMRYIQLPGLGKTIVEAQKDSTTGRDGLETTHLESMHFGKSPFPALLQFLMGLRSGVRMVGWRR